MSKIVRIDTLHSGDLHSCAANGDGVRVVVWWLGCENRCPGCHNSNYWNFDDETFDDFSEEHISKVIDETHQFENIYSGLSVLGGEPFSEKNISDVIKLCQKYKSEFPDKNIWIWSGYTYEYLKEQENEYGDNIKYLLGLCDYLVDGPFIQKLRNVALKFRGSSNQRIIDLKTGEEMK